MKNYVALAALASTLVTAHGAVVFSDDFSEAPGTAIIGKSPDVGSAYTGGPALSVSASNTLSTVGAGRTIFGGFTSSLGAGQIITVSFDTLALNNSFSNGYAGLSLYVAGNERVFLGDGGGGTTWAVDAAAIGTAQLSADSTGTTSALFTYIYDTGAWTFTTASGVNLSGTASANEAFNELRVANGAGGDINVDNIRVDISAVPEPSAFALVGLGGLLAFARRRR